MPELPEVETMRRGIAAVRGSIIEQVERVRCKLKPIQLRPRIDVLRRRVRGCRVKEVGRLGKRVVLRMHDGGALVFEPRMTGLVLIADPPDVEHLRFRVHFSAGPVPQLWYWDRRGLGSVQWYAPGELERRLEQGKLGPDALQLTSDALPARLASSRRAVKVALLDQRAIAGIGNLYASEILHMARIHPERRCTELTNAEWRRLHTALLDVLQTAIKYEGSTLADGTYRNALNNPGGYQKHHRVYGRGGASCFSCRATIQRIVQAQRSTFFCPQCQAAVSSEQRPAE